MAGASPRRVAINIRDTKRKRSGSFGRRNRFALIRINIASFAGFSRQKCREQAKTVDDPCENTRR